MKNILTALLYMFDMLRKYLPLDENDLNTWFSVRANLSSEWDKLQEEERLKGKWEADEGYCKCSICGKLNVHANDFCPNCGADMRVKNELKTS